MARKMWFELVDAATRDAYADTQTASVSSDGVCDIEDLSGAIRGKYHRENPDILEGIVADQLRIYADRAAYDDENTQPLEPRSLLNDLDTQAILIVEVPTQRVASNSVEEVAWTAPQTCPRLVVGKKDPLIRLPWVYIDGAGIGRNVGEDMILYRRAPLRKQWHEIDRCSIRTRARLWVVGPPGTGKSCAALAFAYALNPSEWNVVWIHYRRSEDYFNCVRLMGGEKTTCIVTLYQLAQFKEVLESTSKATAQKTIVFLDGFIEPIHERTAARSMCNSWRRIDEKHRRVVFVCSMGVPDSIFRVEDSRPIISDDNDFDAASQAKESAESKPAGNDDQDVEMTTSISDVKEQMLFILESWRLGEYREAVCHEDFLHSVENIFSVTREQINPYLTEDPGDEDRKPAEGGVDVEEGDAQKAKWIAKLLEEKYFVAGGSARLMFDLSMDDAIRALDQAMRKVTDVKHYLLELAGDSSPTAVNRLLARYRNDDGSDDVRLVSSYVMRKFAKKLGPDDFRVFSRVCEVNPSVDGYVLEGWFLSSLSHSALPIWYVQKDKREMRRWEQTHMYYFDPDKQIQLQISKPTWLVPRKWNQGGYDAVFVNKGRGLVRFVQLTRADKHGYDAEPFVSALVQLAAANILDKVKSVELCYIVPMANLGKFRLPVKSKDFWKGVANVASFAGRRTRQNPDPVFAGCSGEVFLCGVDYEMTNIDHAEGEQVGKKRPRLEAC